MKPFKCVQTKELLLLYTHIIHMHIYIYTCGIHIDTIIKTSEDFFKKIYLSLYCKVCVWEGVGDWTKTAIYWPPLLWPSVLCLSRTPGLLTGGPEAHSAGCGFLYCILSPTGFQTPLGVLRAPSAGWWFYLPHLVSNSSDLQLSNFLSSPNYIIVQSPTQSLEWHVWLSSSGNNCHAAHRSLSSGASVYERTMGFFTLSHFLSQARLWYFLS